MFKTMLTMILSVASCLSYVKYDEKKEEAMNEGKKHANTIVRGKKVTLTCYTKDQENQTQKENEKTKESLIKGYDKSVSRIRDSRIKKDASQTDQKTLRKAYENAFLKQLTMLRKKGDTYEEGNREPDNQNIKEAVEAYEKICPKIDGLKPLSYKIAFIRNLNKGEGSVSEENSEEQSPSNRDE